MSHTVWHGQNQILKIHQGTLVLRTDSDSQGVATQVQALAMFGHSRVYFHCHRRVLWPENRAFLEDGIQMLSQHKIRSESISDILSGRKYTFL